MHHKKEEKNLKTAYSRYIYQNELNKGRFHHDMACGDFEDFPKRTASDKLLLDKVFNNAKNPKYDGYQEVLHQWFTNFFDENSADTNRSTHATQLVMLLKKKLCQINN